MLERGADEIPAQLSVLSVLESYQPRAKVFGFSPDSVLQSLCNLGQGPSLLWVSVFPSIQLRGLDWSIASVSAPGPPWVLQ